MANNGAIGTLLVVGIVGGVGYIVLRNMAYVVDTVRAVDAAQAAEGAGQGGVLPQQQQGLTSHTASAAASSDKTTSHSTYWGRDVKEPLAMGGAGSRLTAADSEGKTIVLTSRGLDASTRSSLWQTTAGVQKVPWDTNPLSYFWDGGRPAGLDTGKVTPSVHKEQQLRSAVSYATGAGMTYDSSRIDGNAFIERGVGLNIPTTPIWEDPVQWFKELF